MASETATPTATVERTEHGNWKAGVVAGLAGGLVMGAMLSLLMTPVIEAAIPALYGLSGGIAGWTIHMANSAILGVVFAALAGALPRYAETPLESAGLGAVYGVVLWVVLAGFVMPIWLAAVGFPMAPPIPNLDPMSLVGHVVYGAILGATYPTLVGRM
ncbi:histidine kinase [Halegenticoccus tardaugens]|uniref:histidine kinase n=1 Tax=Halegenticoccus tardaugens TaxID=2071624 RepID=UPI00100B01C9|nr:histidine kinase [Halegenticoccus tardaugens]